jgi:hypothetical protein
MPNDFQYDVFLSHNSKDKAVVRTVAERLRADGLRVWFDEWVLKPGDSLPAKIEEGLERSRVLVLCMSANAFGSDWAQLTSSAASFHCGSTTPPSKAPWHNSFTSTGSRRTTSRSMRSSSKPAEIRQIGLLLQISDRPILRR